MTTSIRSIDANTSAMLVGNQESFRMTPGGILVPSINGGPFAGFRNRIINGNMRVNQRGPASTTNGGYLVDRWNNDNTAPAGAILFAVGADGAVSRTGLNHLGLSTVVTAGSVAAGDNIGARQTIEGLNVDDLKWGTVDAKPITISFRAGSIGVGNATMSVSVRNGAANRSYVTTVALTSAAQTFTITVPGDTTGTWEKGSAAGIHLAFQHTAGSTYQTATVGAWQAGNWLAATTQTQMRPISNGGFTLTDVQVEVGSVATPFEQRLFGPELALCQRYYESTAFPFFYQSGNPGSVMYVPVYFKVTKRLVPTIALPPPTNQIADSTGTPATPTVWAIAQSTPDACSIHAAYSSNMTGVVGGVLGASAEF